jgi:hypothetical protein
VSNELDWTQETAYIAMLTTTGAACIIPTAWPVVGLMYGYQCNPGNIIEAAHQWQHFADEMAAASADLEQLVQTLPPSTWSGADRDEFGARVADYDRQLSVTRVFATIMVIALVTIALLLTALILLMVVAAAVLAFFAAAILVCLAGAVSAPAAAEIFVEADATALEIAEMLTTSGNIINVTSDALAAGLGVAMAGGIGAEALFGDKHIGHDLAQGLLTGGDTVVWGLLASYEQQFTGLVAGTGFTPGVAVAVADSSPSEKYSVPTGTTILRSLLDPDSAQPQ